MATLPPSTRCHLYALTIVIASVLLAVVALSAPFQTGQTHPLCECVCHPLRHRISSQRLSFADSRRSSCADTCFLHRPFSFQFMQTTCNVACPTIPTTTTSTVTWYKYNSTDCSGTPVVQEFSTCTKNTFLPDDNEYRAAYVSDNSVWMGVFFNSSCRK